LEPRELGANEGLNNFVLLELDLSSKTVPQLGCFLLENIFDIIPDDLQPVIEKNFELFEGFAKCVLAPFFVDNGGFDCGSVNFAKPGVKAGQSYNSTFAASGSPINGAYSGLGVIKPDSQSS